MSIQRTFDWPDKALLLAARQIWDSFLQHYAEISAQRPYWSPEYVEKVSKRIDHTIAVLEHEHGKATPSIIAAMNEIHYKVNGVCNVCQEVFEENPVIRKQFSLDDIVIQYN